MPPPLRITSNDNPRVKAVVRLRDSRDRRTTGLFLAEGFREVERALAARLRIVELYASPEILGCDLAALTARLPWHKEAGDASLFDVSPGVLKKMAYRAEPEGLIAVFEQPRWELSALTGGLLLVGVGVEKPGNLGAMARSCAGAGADGLLIVDEQVDPFNPNAIRASTGAVFSLPVVSVSKENLVAHMKANGFRLLPAMLVDRAKPYTAADYSGNIAIVIGPEDTGLPDEWSDLAAHSGGCPVVIPMNTRRVDSLNAAVAAGVLLFEAVRQRSVQ